MGFQLKSYGIIAILFIILLIGINSVFAVDDLLAIQGNVKQSGTDLSSGNLTVYIFDTQSGGNIIYNSTGDFNNSIVSGKYDVMLGNGTKTLSLEFGRIYFMEIYVNNEIFTYADGSTRQLFQASVGQINSTSINPGQINQSHLTGDVTQWLYNQSQSASLVNVAYLNNSQNFTVNQNFGRNITVDDTGFFARLASSATRIVNGWFTDVNVLNTINVSGEITIGSVSVSPWLYNQTTAVFTGSTLNNTIDARLSNASLNLTINNLNVTFINVTEIHGGKLYFTFINATYINTTNLIVDGIVVNASMIYNHTLVGDTRFLRLSNPAGTNVNVTGDLAINVSGNIDFNSGWQNNGVTITGGNIWAQTLFVYNISSLEVNTLTINGSLLPPNAIAFNNTFDIGSGARVWRNGYFGTEVYIANKGAVSPWLYNQSLSPTITQWLYNQTSSAISILNTSYGRFWYNQTSAVSFTNVAYLNNTQSFTANQGIDANLTLGANGFSNHLKYNAHTGELLFGATGTYDTNLYRQSANLLATNDSVYIGGKVGIGTTTPVPALDVVVSSGGAIKAGDSTNFVTGTYSGAFGEHNNVTGESSFAFGSANIVYGSYSAIIGGYINNVNGTYSAIIGGAGSNVNGTYSAIIGGVENSANGSYSAVVGGLENSAVGSYSAVVGGSVNSVVGSNSAIIGGDINNVNGSSSAIIGGVGNVINRDYSVAIGGQVNVVSGLNSIVAGFGSEATQNVSIAFGTYVISSGLYSIALGSRVQVDGNSSFGIGLNSSDVVASNNITAMNVLGILGTGGRVGIGTPNPSMVLDVRGAGNFSGTVYINNATDLSTVLTGTNVAFLNNTQTFAGVNIFNNARFTGTGATATNISELVAGYDADTTHPLIKIPTGTFAAVTNSRIQFHDGSDFNENLDFFSGAFRMSDDIIVTGDINATNRVCDGLGNCLNVNQSLQAINYLNTTYGKFWYNMTTGSSLFTTNATALYNSTVGYVGIGTTGAGSKLYVSGGNITNIYSNVGAGIFSGVNSYISQPDDSGTIIGGTFQSDCGFGAGNSDCTQYGIKALASVDSTIGTNYGVYASTTGGATSYGVYVDARGATNYGIYSLASKNYFNSSVGIGTINPSYALTIGSLTTALNVSGNLYVNSTGVGIGTATPIRRLDIRQATDGESQLVILVNDQAAAEGSINENVSLRFSFANTVGAPVGGGAIKLGKEADFDPNSDRDAFLAFYTMLDNLETEKVRITAAGALQVGSGTIDTATGTGDLYIQDDLEVDGVNARGANDVYLCLNSAGLITQSEGGLAGTHGCSDAASPFYYSILLDGQEMFEAEFLANLNSSESELIQTFEVKNPTRYGAVYEKKTETSYIDLMVREIQYVDDIAFGLGRIVKTIRQTPQIIEMEQDDGDYYEMNFGQVIVVDWGELPINDTQIINTRLVTKGYYITDYDYYSSKFIISNKDIEKIEEDNIYYTFSFDYSLKEDSKISGSGSFNVGYEQCINKAISDKTECVDYIKNGLIPELMEQELKKLYNDYKKINNNVGDLGEIIL